MIEAAGGVDVDAARRDDQGAEIVVIITAWRDWASLTDALGDDPTRPYPLTVEPGLVEAVTVEHFEALDLPNRPAGLDRTIEAGAPAEFPVR